MTLSVEGLRYSYGSAEVLKDISFDVERGTFLSVLGPNGVGKTTLFRCILGILPDYTGRIAVDGADIRTLSRRALARKIAYIPQIHRPTFGYTVLETVLMGTAHQVGTLSQPKKEHVERACAAMQRLGIEGLTKRNFALLSGGEQQLVLVARAIAQSADILVMDEPTSALDYGNQLRVLHQVRTLADEGYTVLLSTHNPQHALSYGGRLLALSAGQVAAFGKPEAVLTKALIRQLYGVNVDFAETKGGQVIVPLVSEQ